MFKEVLLESGAIDEPPSMMSSYGIPVVILYIALPFAGAFTSGITVSDVSLTFPILITSGIGNNLWFASAAYVAGFIGTMATPPHLCAVMTADFFKSSFGNLLRPIMVAEIPLLLVYYTYFVRCIIEIGRHSNEIFLVIPRSGSDVGWSQALACCSPMRPGNLIFPAG